MGRTVVPRMSLRLYERLRSDLLTTTLACAGIPLDRPIGIATNK